MTGIIELLQERYPEIFRVSDTPVYGDELFQKTEEMKVENYNAQEVKDDGTGIACPHCKGRGDYAVLSEGKFAVRECECAPARRAIKELIKQGLLERELRFDNFHAGNEWQRDMLKAAQDFVDNWRENGAWLVLLGQSGCGKTHLCAAAFCNVVLKQKIYGKYVRWVELVDELKKADSAERDKLMQELKNTPLLYIDDLFKNCSSVEARKLAFDIIDYRSRNLLSTIVSSELTARELREVDEAVESRINGHAYLGDIRCIVSVAKGKDRNYRLRKRK